MKNINNILNITVSQSSIIEVHGARYLVTKPFLISFINDKKVFHTLGVTFYENANKPLDNFPIYNIEELSLAELLEENFVIRLIGGYND